MKTTQGNGREGRGWAHVRPDDANAFLPETAGSLRAMQEQDSEAFAEEFIGSVTMGESVSEDARDEVSEDEEGGPFLMLDDEARLPPEPEESTSEGDDSALKEQTIRGARWAARGA